MKRYKFTIAFENSSSNGYTTEKLIHPLRSFSIPIYWGNSLVTKDFNPKAFINCNDYDNDFDAIIERVKELDNNPDKYLAMLRENPMQPDFDFEQRKKFEEWILNIVKKGNKPLDKGAPLWTTTYQMQRDMKNMETQLLKYRELADELKDIFVTARIDISSPLQENPPFIIENRKTADWMLNYNSYGYVVEKFGKKTEFTLKSCCNTKLRVSLLGKIPKIINNQRVGQWVTYTSVMINGNEVLDKPVSTWHDKPYRYVFEIESGKEYNIHVEWRKPDMILDG